MAIYYEGKATNIHRRWGKVRFTFDNSVHTIKLTIPRKRFPENAREGDKVSYISPGGMAEGYLPDGTPYFAHNIGPEEAEFTLCEDMSKPKLVDKQSWLEKLRGLFRNGRSRS